MGDKYLLSFYIEMIGEDYEQEFNKFKYLGILENPEGFKELEKHINPKRKFKEYRETQEFTDGAEADKNLKLPEWYKKDKDDGIEIG